MIMANTIDKKDLLMHLSLKKSKWMEIREKERMGEQNVTHENFINDVILTLDWIINDVTNM